MQNQATNKYIISFNKWYHIIASENKNTKKISLKKNVYCTRLKMPPKRSYPGKGGL